MRIVLLILMCLALSNCAMMVNGARQQVQVNGGPEGKVVKLKTPDGTFEVDNGSTSFTLSRSRSDIPITIICPDGSKKEDTTPTQFDWLWGGAGNLFNGGIGWFIDPFSDQAFVIKKTYSLANFCQK